MIDEGHEVMINRITGVRIGLSFQRWFFMGLADLYEPFEQFSTLLGRKLACSVQVLFQYATFLQLNTVIYV